MKNVSQILKGWPGMIGMMGLLVLMLSSCLKDNNNNNVQPPTALLTVIDASPDAPALDFYLDNNKVNNYPLTYGSNDNGLEYFRAFAGNRVAGFYQAGTLTKSASDTISLSANHYYSLFLTNQITKPDFVLLTDSITRPTTGMGSVRLVNVSPDAPAVDLAVKSGSLLVSSVAYKHASPFAPISPSSNDTLVVRQAGTGTVIATMPGISIQSNNVYTVWLQGLVNNTGNEKVNAQIMTNAYFF